MGPNSLITYVFGHRLNTCRGSISFHEDVLGLDLWKREQGGGTTCRGGERSEENMS